MENVKEKGYLEDLGLCWIIRNIEVDLIKEDWRG